jgi:hypothetical protein
MRMLDVLLRRLWLPAPCQARLEAHERDHPNDHNMYIMELESGYYLDAR